MTAELIIKQAINDGVNFVLSDTGIIKLSGDKNAVNRWASVIRKNKQAIIALLTRNQELAIRTWLTHIGEPEEDHYIVLNKCRRNPEALAYYLERAAEYACEQRWQKVLSLLAENPDKQRVYVTDTITDPDNVILTVAIRGVATFEMLVPQDRYDPFLLVEMIDKELLQ
jgi:hypothetical protein